LLVPFFGDGDAAAAALPSRPNILIITADNLGYGDVGCFGNQQIRTPHMDRLAAEGARCTDFYTASPTCSVSRASLLTGRYPQRHGLVEQLPGLEGNYGVGLDPREILLPALLKQAGYRTGCFGKWNIGFAPGSRPTERGFDEFFGHASGNIDYYTHVYQGREDMHRGIEPVQVDGYSTDLFADAACDFIRRHAASEFFVYLTFNAPHFPNPRNKQPGEPAVWQAPRRAFDVYGYDPDTKNEVERYRAVVTAMDDAIGRVLDQLDSLALTANTFVVCFSDNGAFMLERRGLEVASNKPFRDGGVTLWEGGIRVPGVVRWPQHIPAGYVCRAPLLSCDMFATSLALAGAPLPADRAIDGRDVRLAPRRSLLPVPRL
jgi:arylsulfatase A-like enzyme